MRVAVLPSGALFLDTASVPDPADGLTPAARPRLARAFERGPGHALLDLGATELDAPLAPELAFLRDVGRAFVTRLCAVPDLEERRERVGVDCPLDERERLAGAVPPMDGAEYVDAEWVGARWAEINEARASRGRAGRALLPGGDAAAGRRGSERGRGLDAGGGRGLVARGGRGKTIQVLDRLIEDKQALARGVLTGGGETLLTELSDAELMAMVALDLRRATAEA